MVISPATTAPVVADDPVTAPVGAASCVAVPRMRGVLHEVAFPMSMLSGLLAVSRAAPGPARAATTVYAVTLSTCLGVSALYHRGHWSPPVRRRLRRIDHSAIFALVAGTFTPIAVLAVPRPLAVITLVVTWGGAGAGALVVALRRDPPRAAELAVYGAATCVGLLLLPWLVGSVGAAAAALLAAGGAIYGAGALVFASHRPNPWPRTFGFHEVFHSLVLAAALVQWVAIIRWVLRPG